MYWHTHAKFLAYKIFLRCTQSFFWFLKKLYLIYDSSIKKKQCYSKQDRSGSFMINGVKKLEFIFKISVAHTETINPIYWAPTMHQPKKTNVKFQKEAILYHKTLILVCVPPLQNKKQKISPIYQEIFWV